MRVCTYFLLSLTLLPFACGGRQDAESDPPLPQAASVPAPSPQASIPDRPPIDLGDVDSGIMILGKLAPESESATVTADYIETQRSRLSITTITVRAPFPDELFVQFEMASTRDFVERPVVTRVRAYRDEETQLGDEHAYVMGSTARQPEPDASGVVVPRAFVVDVMAGLEEAPDTMLVHAEADAWLMETDTDESTLDPFQDTSPERVSLFSNPVRINFEREVASL